MSLGGTDQWIQIRGQSRSNPLLRTSRRPREVTTPPAQPIHGSLDKETQRIAFKIGEKSSNVLEVGLESLTRKTYALMDERFGLDQPTGEPIVHKVVIVMGTGLRIEG